MSVKYLVLLDAGYLLYTSVPTLIKPVFAVDTLSA